MSDDELIDQLAQLAQIDDGDRALLWETYRRIVAATFERLNEAGRLLPPVVETREEWHVEYVNELGATSTRTYPNKTDAEMAEEFSAAAWLGMTVEKASRRTVSTLTGGGVHISGWREVSP